MSEPLVSQLIEQSLCAVMDPEAAMSIVDLGLIYKIEMRGERQAHILMTTTARGCPAAGFLTEAVRHRLLEQGHVDAVDVELTYEPPWNSSMIRV